MVVKLVIPAAKPDPNALYDTTKYTGNHFTCVLVSDRVIHRLKAIPYAHKSTALADAAELRAAGHIVEVIDL